MNKRPGNEPGSWHDANEFRDYQKMNTGAYTSCLEELKCTIPAE
jgi:hypothetical protein